MPSPGTMAARGFAGGEGTSGLPRGLSEASPGRPVGLGTSHEARCHQAPALAQLDRAAPVPSVQTPAHRPPALGRLLGVGPPWAQTAPRLSSGGEMGPQPSPGLVSPPVPPDPGPSGAAFPLGDLYCRLESFSLLFWTFASDEESASVCVYVCVCIYVYVCVCVGTCVCLYVCVCVYMYV